jgi:hypothetical protein
MKSLKLSFTAFAVVAIVGSALAITKPYGITYCIKTLGSGSGNCTGSKVGQAEAIAAGKPATHIGVIKGAAACTSTFCSTDIRILDDEG